MSMQMSVFNSCYKYIADKGYKVYIIINTKLMNEDTLKPYANIDGNIILNVSMNAVKSFQVTAVDIQISIGFRGTNVFARVPFAAIWSIYANEDPTIGMMYCNSFAPSSTIPVEPVPPSPPKVNRPKLTLVKN